MYTDLGRPGDTFAVVFIKSSVVTGLCNNTRPCILRALNHIIPSTDCVCYFLCDPDRAGIQPALTSPRVMGHFTYRSLHSLKPSVTSQPIQSKLNLISVTSQPIIYL